MKDLTKKQLQDKIDELQKAMLTAPDFIPWQPVGGDYYVSIDGQVISFGSTELAKLQGAARATKEQTEKARDAMRVFNRLLAYKDEFAPDFVHKTGDIVSCQIAVNVDGDYRMIGSNHAFSSPTTIYFPASVAGVLVDKLNSGEVVL